MSAATTTVGGLTRAGRPEEPVIADTTSQDHGIPRFFYAAAIALVISAIHGVLMRLPIFAEWIRLADYGGHMITNLSHTHITIVGAGTIMLTALMYYIMPRLGKVPLYSTALTNVSFWCTTIGVFAFYIVIFSLGLYEGAMVHAGWQYQAAREYMGAWHKVPVIVSAAIMGIGYWTFVVNVWVTTARVNAFRKANPEKGASPIEWLLILFCCVSATGLFIGTVQGVYQVMPWSLDWLLKAGHAGQLIDPQAHAHMNLVGGVTIGMMALLYYFLPRMLGRPIYSFKLARFSFFAMVIGVSGFYLASIILGFVEGTPVVEGRMTVMQAEAMTGLWHTLPIVGSAIIMGLGFWSFIANILLTIKQGPAKDAPADSWLSKFIAFSVLALLVGTIQGVLQTLPPIHNWLESSMGTGWMVMPFAHAQTNMVGFALTSLITLSVFALPRITGRPIYSPVFAKRMLTVLATGVGATYVVYVTLGLLETAAMHSMMGPQMMSQMMGAMDEYLPHEEAVLVRSVVGGDIVHYSLIIGTAMIVAAGFLMFFRHMYLSLGAEMIHDYWAAWRSRIAIAASQHAKPHASALPEDLAQAPRSALQLAFYETVGGWLGFMGMGWLISGRGFIGIMVLAAWASIYWTSLFILVAITVAGPVATGIIIVTWILLPLLSGFVCWRTYMRAARELVAAEGGVAES